jgi:RNA polymerase sigma-70 factor, ECF subfamily
MTVMPLTDANVDLDLLRRMRAGETLALACLYQRHQAPLYRFALLRSGSPDVAADVVQDVFMALIEGKLNFDPLRGALSSFLYGVARNFMLKRADGERRYLSPQVNANDEDNDNACEVADCAITPLEKILMNERAESVRVALAQIAPHYRDVLILYEIQDLSYVEIANICHIDIGTVRSRLSRARAKCAALLAPMNDTHVDERPAYTSDER